MVVGSRELVWAIAKMAGKIAKRQIVRSRAIVGEDLRWLALIMMSSLAHCIRTRRLSLDISSDSRRHFRSAIDQWSNRGPTLQPIAKLASRLRRSRFLGFTGRRGSCPWIRACRRAIVVGTSVESETVRIGLGVNVIYPRRRSTETDTKIEAAAARVADCSVLLEAVAVVAVDVVIRYNHPSVKIGKS